VVIRRFSGLSLFSRE